MSQNVPIFLGFYEELARQCRLPVDTVHFLGVVGVNSKTVSDFSCVRSALLLKNVHVHPSWFCSPSNVSEVPKDAGCLFLGSSGFPQLINSSELNTALFELDCIPLSLETLKMKTQREVFTGRQVWNISTCDSESARWQIRFFFLNWDKAKWRIFLRGGESVGSWLLTIVSWPFICLYSNRRIICLKWHHIVDGREAYCPPFMSRMKETESQCSSRWDRRESTITLPHLHKASIHPLASQDWGLLPPQASKEEAGETAPVRLVSPTPPRPGWCAERRQSAGLHFRSGRRGTDSVKWGLGRDERSGVGESRQSYFWSVALKSITICLTRFRNPSQAQRRQLIQLPLPEQRFRSSDKKLNEKWSQLNIKSPLLYFKGNISPEVVDGGEPLELF